MADKIEQMGLTQETHQKVCCYDVCFNYRSYTATGALWYDWYLIIWSCVEQKFEELHDKYVVQVRECHDLSSKLESTEVSDFYLYVYIVMDLC